MRTTLVASADVSDDVVYSVVRKLFENLADFRKRHPSFKQLDPQRMIDGQSAPVHPGAERYFREAGLI
jgi:TRAP-type uncharacterized transport system substrate-binding protein